MSRKIIVRWHDWSGKGIEHLVLHEGPDEIVADAAILGTAEDEVFAARYRILCDESWRVRKAGIAQIGGGGGRPNPHARPRGTGPGGGGRRAPTPRGRHIVNLRQPPS